MVYRRRMYRRRYGRRRGRYTGRQRRVFRRSLRRTNLAPEVKFIDTQVTTTTVLGTSNWASSYVTPVNLVQGTSNGQIIGEKIRTRYMVINMRWRGPNNDSANNSYPDGLVRLVFWTPIQEYTYVNNYMNTSANINRLFDYNLVMILRDMTFKLGNGTTTENGLAVSYTKTIKILIPWPRNAKLRRLTDGTFKLDEQKDTIFMSYKAEPNDAFYDFESRLTYIDN